MPLSESHRPGVKHPENLTDFHRLLSKVSAKYINLPVEEIESVAKEDFGRLAAVLGGDSCRFHLFDLEKKVWVNFFDKTVEMLMWFRHVSVVEIMKEASKDPDCTIATQYIFDRWSMAECFIYPCPEGPSKTPNMIDRFFRHYSVERFISVPIFAGGDPIGAIVMTVFDRVVVWPEDIVERLRLYGEVFANALVRKRSEVALRKSFSEMKQLLSEVKKLKEQVEADYLYLKEETDLEHDFRDIVGISDVIRSTFIMAKQVAPMDVTVLILGETGTGKGILAQAIHNASRRNGRPMIHVNCAALSSSLIESELFGHEKGAFTGANTRKIGRFELAKGTTLFLDEIGELPLDLQAKLLRVLQDGMFERVGDSTTVRTDARVLAATNKDLAKEVQEGSFRQDLWYRLNVFPLHVPALRERPEDIPVFVDFFIKKYEPLVGKHFNKVPKKTIKALQEYSWPGNIRELENLIERAVITSRLLHLQIDLPPCSSASLFPRGWTLQEMERAYIIQTLEKTGWVIEGPDGAAVLLGLNHATLRSRMKKLHIFRPTPAMNARKLSILS